MKRIDVKIKNQEFTFRTNNNGDYLFVGVNENHQISTESGFDSLRKIKTAIREYLKNKFFFIGSRSDSKMPRIRYTPSKNVDWRA